MKLLPLLASGALTSLVSAQVTNLRITEVDPHADQVEVTNFGPAFVTTADRPFCHSFNYSSRISSGTSFAAGEAKVFAVTGLDDVDSDLWLYLSGPFGNGANIVHGVKYGPIAGIGRAGLATSVGLWPSAAAFAPAPAPGQTLAFDGLGNATHDWYVDDTPSMGAADSEPVGVTPGTLAVPVGSEGFEPADRGELVQAVAGWVIVDNGATDGDFDIRVVDDVNGSATPVPSPGSTRWLRVHDTDASAAQNRFYSPFQSTGATALPYELSFDVNLIDVPTAAVANRPRIVMQHRVAAGVTNTWGIEFHTFSASLVVVANGGTPAIVSLGSLPQNTWGSVSLAVDFAQGTVTAQIAGSAPQALPIAPAAFVDPTEMRFCYRGEGLDNTATMLLDNVRFAHGVQSLEVVRDATPPNPGTLLPGLSPPALGATWDPRIQSTFALPLIDALVITPLSQINIPLPEGAVLVDPGLSLVTLVGLPGVPFAVALPNDLMFMGVEFSSQGVTFDASTFRLTNALDLTVGY